MRHWLAYPIGVGMAVIVFSGVTLAQTAHLSGAPKGVPDLSGIWEEPPRIPLSVDVAICGPANNSECIPEEVRERIQVRRPGPAGTPGGRAVETSGLPMLPWAAAKYKSIRDQADSDNRVEFLDPRFSGCMPIGVTRLGDPLEIRQFPEVVFLFTDEDHWVRRIYVDGREHPKDLKPTWMGYSIGKYDGDTLVVDTIGMNDKTWLDGQGHPHTDALHIVERFRRLDTNSLEVELTIDDPKAYTKPWNVKRVYKLLPPDFELYELVQCEELLKMGTHYSTPPRK